MNPPEPDAVRDVVLVTGGGSGIGMALAQAFHARGATVIIAGRNRMSLQAVAAACPGMLVEEVDVASAASVEALSTRVTEAHPGLNVLVNNAGIQQLLDFAGATPPDALAIAREIDTNLKGLVHVSAAFLPLLRRQRTARLVHVGSGLGYVPLAAAPIYSATKAAVHSFTISLRLQLAGSPVKVIEIIPPVVATGLHRGQTRRPPNAMPLDDFARAAMAGLDAGRTEIAVGLAKVLRIAHRIAPGLFLRIINKPR
jgi:uncharacterized oxidoreductase